MAESRVWPRPAAGHRDRSATDAVISSPESSQGQWRQRMKALGTETCPASRTLGAPVQRRCAFARAEPASSCQSRCSVDFDVCNKGTVPVEVVTAQKNEPLLGLAGVYWDVDGTTVAPGKCKNVYGEPLGVSGGVHCIWLCRCKRPVGIRHNCPGARFRHVLPVVPESKDCDRRRVRDVRPERCDRLPQRRRYSGQLRGSEIS